MRPTRARRRRSPRMRAFGSRYLPRRATSERQLASRKSGQAGQQELEDASQVIRITQVGAAFRDAVQPHYVAGVEIGERRVAGLLRATGPPARGLGKRG